MQISLRMVLAVLVAFGFAVLTPTMSSAGDDPQIVDLDVNIGASEAFYVKAKAKFVSGGSDTAAVLVHQSGEDMHGWTFLADTLQRNDVASIATNESRAGDVLAGIDFLNERGYSKIVLIGASLGGGAILRAWARPGGRRVAGIVFLGSGPGPDFADTALPTLHIISSRDVFARRAYQVHESAAGPKTLLELDTDKHAQALFGGDLRDRVAEAIMDFIIGEK